jgi:putative tricarboxylic transport membrane protein
LKTHDRISGLIWVVLGIGICIGSVKLRLGDFHKPGPGFMPFLSGSFLILFGLILAVSTISKGLEKEKTKGKEAWMNVNWKSLLFTLLALFVYALLLEPLGFYITTFMFLFFLFKLTEPKRWLTPIVFAGISVILSYLIFSTWLKVQFPSGIFR